MHKVIDEASSEQVHVNSMISLQRKKNGKSFISLPSEIILLYTETRPRDQSLAVPPLDPSKS